MYNAKKIQNVMYKEYDDGYLLREETHDISVKGGRLEIFNNRICRIR